VVAKIDRSFVKQIKYCSKTITHIQDLIEAHGARVLVLGVDTETQKELLLKFGIYVHQGHHVGCPQLLRHYIKNDFSLA
jgi:EAL domain-containing protein (putative c-di-GMP-specific phosphodiesterase class I)